MSKWEKQDRFLMDVKDHTMTVIFDHGVNRHLKFSSPKTSSCWFEIITWENCLCINGDMGSYVFSRTQDMFNFFRTDTNDFNYAGKENLSINPGYWHEKMKADSRYEPSKGFSREYFKDFINSYYNDYCDWNDISADKRDDLWDEIERHIMSVEINNEYAAHTVLSEFKSYEVPDFDFGYVENDFNEFSYHYLWCLCAIVWAIQYYDNSKMAANYILNDEKVI